VVLAADSLELADQLAGRVVGSLELADRLGVLAADSLVPAGLLHPLVLKAMGTCCLQPVPSPALD